MVRSGQGYDGPFGLQKSFPPSYTRQFHSDFCPLESVAVTLILELPGALGNHFVWTFSPTSVKVV